MNQHNQINNAGPSSMRLPPSLYTNNISNSLTKLALLESRIEMISLSEFKQITTYFISITGRYIYTVISIIFMHEYKRRRIK